MKNTTKNKQRRRQKIKSRKNKMKRNAKRTLRRGMKGGNEDLINFSANNYYKYLSEKKNPHLRYMQEEKLFSLSKSNPDENQSVHLVPDIPQPSTPPTPTILPPSIPPQPPPPSQPPPQLPPQPTSPHRGKQHRGQHRRQHLQYRGQRLQHRGQPLDKKKIKKYSEIKKKIKIIIYNLKNLRYHDIIDNIVQTINSGNFQAIFNIENIDNIIKQRIKMTLSNNSRTMQYYTNSYNNTINNINSIIENLKEKKEKKIISFSFLFKQNKEKDTIIEHIIVMFEGIQKDIKNIYDMVNQSYDLQEIIEA